MSTTRGILLLTGLIATAIGVGVRPAHGTVVLCDEQFAAQSSARAVPWAQFDLGLVTNNGDETRRTSATTVTSLLIESSGAPSRPLPERGPMEIKAVGAPVGMAPDNSSLNQVTGSGAGGSAAPSALESPATDDLLTSLPPESRLLCPSGPKCRWFRPPRSLALTFV